MNLPIGPSARKFDGDWPEPVTDAAYGIGGKLVELMGKHSEADPVAGLVQLLALAGCVIGRRAYVPVEGDRHYPALWPLIIGDTSRARKGTSFGVARSLLKEAEPDFVVKNIKGGLSSGEGALAPLADPPEDEEEVRVVDKRLVAYEPEFARLLRVSARQGNTLKDVLRQLWDSGNSGNMTKHDGYDVRDGHLSIVGHIVEKELRREFASVDAANGFGNRFLFVLVRRSETLRPDGAGIPAKELKRLGGELSAILEWASSLPSLPVRRAPDAEDLWEKIYRACAEGDQSFESDLTSRAEAQMTRLALTYALLDKSKTIRLEHLCAALDLWRFSEQSIYRIYRGQSSKIEQLLSAIRERKEAGLAKSEIWSHIKDKHEQSELLERLVGDGRVMTRELGTSGRTKTIYIASEFAFPEKSKRRETREAA